eukprot:scaffold14567_cov84-Phaeocystis_antarctica.AAC.1
MYEEYDSVRFLVRFFLSPDFFGFFSDFLAGVFLAGGMIKRWQLRAPPTRPPPPHPPARRPQPDAEGRNRAESFLTSVATIAAALRPPASPPEPAAAAAVGEGGGRFTATAWRNRPKTSLASGAGRCACGLVLHPGAAGRRHTAPRPPPA